MRHLAFEVGDSDEAVATLVSQGISVEEVRVDALTESDLPFLPTPDGLPLELYKGGCAPSANLGLGLGRLTMRSMDRFVDYLADELELTFAGVNSWNRILG